jgi:hypothetical protein
LPQACFKRLPQVFQQCVGVRRGEFLQSRNACRHREGIAAQRSSLVNGAKRRQAIHDFRSSSKSPHRQAAADHFAKTR